MTSSDQPGVGAGSSDPSASQNPCISPPGHLSPDEFRALGHRMVDWVADYHASLEDRPVMDPTKPGEVAAALPESPPARPGGVGEWDSIFSDLDTIVTPNLLHWQSPRFFGYFPCNASGPAILAEIASAGINVNGMLWATSPAATELETRMLDWSAELFGLPDRFRSTGDGGGCIQGTASEATLLGLLAGRDRIRRSGARTNTDTRWTVYASQQAHSSVVKAAMIAGLADGPKDDRCVRLISTDGDGAMDTAELGRVIAKDAADPAVQPALIVATVGTTSTGAVDPLAAIAATADEAWRGVRDEAFPGWLHADAAWAGSALVCPEHRGMIDGLDKFDSLCINPHKWLLTNFDCDLMWTADRRALIDALTITPEYLRNAASDSGSVLDYRDWQVPLGRRLRALKLWFVLRHYGTDGLRAHIRGHIEMASEFEGWVKADDRFELACERRLSLVCFGLKAGDEANLAMVEAVNKSGRAFVSSTKLRLGDWSEPRVVVRLAVGATRTERRHVAQAWDAIRDAAGEVLG